MRTIAIINLKGGVGKTTTAVNLAAALYEREKTVLIIDADPQANATQYLVPKIYQDDLAYTLCDVMSCSIPSGESCIYETGLERIDLLPADISLIQADIASVREGGKIRRIRDLCDELAADGVYDFVIIDCPPCFTASSVAAIYAADDIIVPVLVDAFSVSGMAELMYQIKSVKALQPHIHVLITQRHNSPACVQGEEALRTSGLPVYDFTIRRSEKVTEAAFKHQSVLAYSPRSAAAHDYRWLAEEYLEEAGMI